MHDGDSEVADLVSAYWRGYRLRTSSERSDRLEADSLLWASEAVTEHIEDGTSDVVGLIVALVDGAGGDETALCYFGAGPLEDLLRHYGPPAASTVAALEDAARRRADLRHALRCVWWTEDDDPALRERFERLNQ